ncbi:MAG: hypothetical protein ACRD9S_24385 [Pyrinomonadaceae bacterium]
MSSRVKRENLRQLSYAEFGEILHLLTASVSDYLARTGTKVDMVSPILRGGAITGMHLESHLAIVRTLPLQFNPYALTSRSRRAFDHERRLHLPMGGHRRAVAADSGC